MKLELTYDDRNLTVTGTHHEAYAATMIDPGSPEHFEISRVFDGDIEISYLFSDAQWEALAEAALDAAQGEDEFAREQAAEWRREDMRMGAW